MSVSSGMICGDSQDISIVEETRATEAQLRKGNLSDMMQEENTKIGVAADDALEAPPMAPAVRSIVHKVFRITYWLRKSILSFFLSLIIYSHKLLAPVLNYQSTNQSSTQNQQIPANEKSKKKVAVSIAINNDSLPRDKGHKNKADDDKGIFYDSFEGARDDHDIDHNVERRLEELNSAWLPRKLDTYTLRVIRGGVESDIQQSTKTNFEASPDSCVEGGSCEVSTAGKKKKKEQVSFHNKIEKLYICVYHFCMAGACCKVLLLL